jgi:hypothetical protein
MNPKVIVRLSLVEAVQPLQACGIPDGGYFVPKLPYQDGLEITLTLRELEHEKVDLSGFVANQDALVVNECTTPRRAVLAWTSGTESTVAGNVHLNDLPRHPEPGRCLAFQQGQHRVVRA